MTAVDLLAPARAGWRHAWPAGWKERAALCAVLAWAALLRALFLREPIRFDEAANALYYADRSLLHAVGGMAGNENHGLASLSMWIAVRVLGWSEAAVRLPTLVCGAVLCWMLYAGLRWYTKEAVPALAGAALAAVSPWLVFFSVNARGYMWQACAVALLAPLVLAVRRGTAIPATVLGLWAGGLTAAGAFAARSFLVFAAGLFLGSALLTARRRFLFAWAGSAAALTLAAYAVAIAAHGARGMIGIASTLRQPLGRALAETVSGYAAVLPALADSAGCRVFQATVAVLAAGSALAWRRVAPFGALVLSVLVSGLAVTAVVRLGLYARVLLPLASLLLPWLALALTALARPARMPGWLLIAVLLAAYPALWLHQDLLRLRNSTGDMPAARPLARQLLARSDLGTSIAVLPPILDVGVAFYFRQASVPRAGIHNYGLGLDPERHCGFTQALVFVPEEQALDDVLRDAGDAPWRPRLRPSELRKAAVPEAEGEIIQIPLTPCPAAGGRGP